jgi:hypothetical protein
MDYSTRSSLESKLGVSINYTEGNRGGYDSCEVEVPWAIMSFTGHADPSEKKLAQIEAEMGKHGFLLMSHREHRPFGRLMAGSKTIMVFQRVHRG